jgi:L-seryl-tRNA(Ser) seleniumtransferase
VDLDAFHKACGKHIARLLNVEACSITCGAAAGLAIATAACMAGRDPAKRLQLPDTSGLKNEVIVLKAHRILYDQAVLLSGARFVEAGHTSSALPEQVEAAISERTALFFYAAECEPMRGSIPLPALLPMLKAHGIPVLVDAAAELPPVSNLHKYLDMGADLVAFSGGKELRGPQSSGLLLGREDLIAACDACCCPNYGIGRPMKVDKETAAGITRAVELFLEKDYDRENQRWAGISLSITQTPEICAKGAVRTGYPQEPGVQPANILRAYIKPTARSAQQVADALRARALPIHTDISGDELVINPQCLSDDEVGMVIRALVEAL